METLLDVRQALDQNIGNTIEADITPYIQRLTARLDILKIKETDIPNLENKLLNEYTLH